MKNIFKIIGAVCLAVVISACGDCPPETVVAPPVVSTTPATTVSTVTPETPVVVALPVVQPPNTVLCDLTTYVPCQTPTYIPAPVCNYETYIPCDVAPPVCADGFTLVLGICEPVVVICPQDDDSACARSPVAAPRGVTHG